MKHRAKLQERRTYTTEDLGRYGYFFVDARRLRLYVPNPNWVVVSNKHEMYYLNEDSPDRFSVVRQIDPRRMQQRAAAPPQRQPFQETGQGDPDLRRRVLGSGCDRPPEQFRLGSDWVALGHGPEDTIERRRDCPDAPPHWYVIGHRTGEALARFYTTDESEARKVYELWQNDLASMQQLIPIDQALEQTAAAPKPRRRYQAYPIVDSARGARDLPGVAYYHWEKVRQTDFGGTTILLQRWEGPSYRVFLAINGECYDYYTFDLAEAQRVYDEWLADVAAEEGLVPFDQALAQTATVKEASERLRQEYFPEIGRALTLERYVLDRGDRPPGVYYEVVEWNARQLPGHTKGSMSRVNMQTGPQNWIQDRRAAERAFEEKAAIFRDVRPIDDVLDEQESEPLEPRSSSGILGGRAVTAAYAQNVPVSNGDRVTFEASAQIKAVLLEGGWSPGYPERWVRNRRRLPAGSGVIDNGCDISSEALTRYWGLPVRVDGLDEVYWIDKQNITDVRPTGLLTLDEALEKTASFGDDVQPGDLVQWPAHNDSGTASEWAGWFGGSANLPADFGVVVDAKEHFWGVTVRSWSTGQLLFVRKSRLQPVTDAPPGLMTLQDAIDKSYTQKE